jgi:hypothetical protein
MWDTIVTEDGERHVIPKDDIIPHEPDTYCWCHPTDDDGVIVHHSMDRRELAEQRQAREARNGQ